MGKRWQPESDHMRIGTAIDRIAEALRELTKHDLVSWRPEPDGFASCIMVRVYSEAILSGEGRERLSSMSIGDSAQSGTPTIIALRNFLEFEQASSEGKNAVAT
jgi:hypothetical protein